MCNVLDGAWQTVAFLWPRSQEACFKETCVPSIVSQK